VVITGMGIVSSIGSSIADVHAALISGYSGMKFLPEMQELGYRCCIFAPVAPYALPESAAGLAPLLSTAARFGLAACAEAVQAAGLSPEQLASPAAGVVFGSGCSGRCDRPGPPAPDAELADPLTAFQLLGGAIPAVIAYHWGMTGPVASISTACATGLYNIGTAYEMVREGEVELCLTGSAEGDVWDIVGLSGDNSNGMPVDWNDRPTQSCRPFDVNRQGFVMSAGAGALVLESLTHARQRGARIVAEVLGYGAANDGADIFNASGIGQQLAIDQAFDATGRLEYRDIDYINAHGTGTPRGDVVESQLLARLFGEGPLVSSTKGQTGHGQGATAAQEAVFTALMLEHGFVAPTRNLERIDPDCAGIRHVQRLQAAELRTAMTINNGLGGVNACLILGRPPAA
jgi:3-oxoacyl-[acyl-carrier-protein] synthase-1